MNHPLSPAIHLGADRIVAISVRYLRPPHETRTREAEDGADPERLSLSDIAGILLNAVFLDSVDSDLERLERINRTLSLIPEEVIAQGKVSLRPVRVMFISPSEPIERIAARFVHELPPMVRFVLRPTGALNRSGSNLASYLLFEESFCRALIDLGYQDTMARADEVRAFFEGV